MHLPRFMSLTAALVLVLGGCNLDFSPAPLKPTPLDSSEVETSEASDADGDQALADGDTDEVDSSAVDCERALLGSIDWDCIPAPRCGGKLLTMRTASGYRSALICPEGGVQRWHVYENGTWLSSFEFGLPSDRPIVHRLDSDLTEYPGLVQRGGNDELLWVFRQGLETEDVQRLTWQSALDTFPFVGPNTFAAIKTQPWVFRRSDGFILAHDGRSFALQLAEFNPTQAVFKDAHWLIMHDGQLLLHFDLQQDVAVQSHTVALNSSSLLVLPHADMLLDCSQGKLQVFGIHGEERESYELPQAAACLPGVDGIDGAWRYLAFLPNSGVMLRKR